MVSLEVIALVLTGLSITASILYYSSVLGNQNKTRQTQMFMQLYNTRIDEKNADRFWRILSLTWDDFDDYVERYSLEKDRAVASDLASEIAYYDGLGILLKQKMVDRSIMYELMGLRSIMLWFKCETIFKRMRAADGLMSAGEDFAANFEYLVDEMIKIKKEKNVKLPTYWLHPTSTLLKKYNR